jgi:DNA-binding response OmpR family regulator
MSNVLLIYDDRSAKLTVEGVLASLGISPVRMVLDQFAAEFLLAEMFDLIIFELFGENRSCISILKQLEKLAATSGIDHPPVIVVTEQGFDITEKALRTAKVSFFFIKPLAEAELTAAIRQSLQPPPAL